MSILTQLITVSAQHQPVTVPDLELSFYRAMPLRVRLAVTDGAGLSDMTAFSSVSVLVKSDRDDAATTLMAKTTSDLAEVTQTQVDAGTHESAAVEFTAAECNLALTGKFRNLWLVVKGTLNDGQEVILGAGKVIVYESAASAGEPPENADPALSLAAAEGLFLSTANVQELSSEARAIALGNLGLDGELLTEDAADLLYAPLSAVSTLETAIAGKEPMQTLATELEMQAGTQTAARRMSPALIKAAIDALSSGGPGIDLPVSIADGGTGVTTGQAARVALGVEEVIAATAQEVAISFSTSEPEAPWGGTNFDLSTTTQTVRVWFDDGIEPAPDAPVGGRLLSVGYIGDAYMQADALAAALESDAAFTATLLGVSVTVTNVTAGLCVAAYNPPSNAYISGSLNTVGANAYQRLSPLNGQELQNINAVKLGGNPSSFFAPGTHQHAFSSLLTRPRFAALGSDAVSSSTTLATIGGSALQVSVTAGTWLFEAQGMMTTSGATEGISLAINGPTASHIRGDFTIPTNGLGAVINASVTTWESKVTSTAMVAASRGRWHISGRFVATASGAFAVRFSAETGGANSVTIPAGAILCVYPAG
jgi:hypothetical protein